MKKIKFEYVLFITISIFLCCKKEFDHPPYRPANDGAKLLISQLKSRLLNQNGYHKFGDGDTNLYGYVIADETNGNLYKQIFVTDDAGSGLMVKLRESGGVFAGDKIRINLNGLYLINSNSMIYLDSVDLVKSVVKISSGHKLLPKVTSIPDILKYASDPLHPSSLQSRLVELNGVEFIAGDRNKLFGDPIGKSATERTLTDCQNNTIVIRTGGFANFTSKFTPTGNGKILAIVSQYDDDMQLLLRNYSEIQLASSPCTGAPSGTNSGSVYVSKDFAYNSLTSGGWTNINATGLINWTVSSFGGEYFGKISNYSGGTNTPCETWLISPPLNLSSSINPVFSFKNAYKFTGPSLEVYVSMNYSSAQPSSASWTKLNFTPSSGDYVFVNSGDISLNNYKSATTRLAFKYTGTSSSGSTWEIDDILVKEQ